MKILVAIANYGTKNMGFLRSLIREYQSMPYDMDIVVLSNIPKELGPRIEVRVGLPSRNPRSLPFVHKKLFAERANNYDLFIYTEDDTLVTENHIGSFLEATRVLPENEIAGFMRYEVDPTGKKYYSTVHSRFHWVPGSVKTIGEYSFARFTNEHSACHLLTRQQLKMAIDSGGYVVEPHTERYDLLETAATDPYTQCGLIKVICISHFQDFVLHHLPDIYIGKLGLADNEFHLQIKTLLKNQNNKDLQGLLFPVETKVKQERWSKSYYEKCRNDIIALIPDRVKNVLSIGCGWGATEEALVQKGHKVVAIPLDSIIGVCAEAKGVEVTCPDFEKAFEIISGRRFDCMIFSEILQHLQYPVKVLSRYAGLLTGEGIVIVSAPNFHNIKYRRQLSSEKILVRDIKGFDKAGFHLTSKRMVDKWLQQSKLEAVHFLFGFEGRSRRIAQITPGILKHLIAAHYLVVARRSH